VDEGRDAKEQGTFLAIAEVMEKKPTVQGNSSGPESRRERKGRNSKGNDQVDEKAMSMKSLTWSAPATEGEAQWR